MDSTNNSESQKRIKEVAKKGKKRIDELHEIHRKLKSRYRKDGDYIDQAKFHPPKRP